MKVLIYNENSLKCPSVFFFKPADLQATTVHGEVAVTVLTKLRNYFCHADN